ncbi:MAG: FUSC family protein [bacterium]|nr:FUSC family protein [bacterium]
MLRKIVQGTMRFDRSAIELGLSLRCTIGVAIPLLLGLLAGNAAYGLSAAVGALIAGFASMQGVYRTRAAAMLITSGAMAVSTFVGGLVGHSTAAVACATALWAFAYGLLASLGPSAAAVGLNSVVALVIYSDFQLTPEQAALQSLLLLAGGGLQTLLLVLVWPLRRFSAERHALAGAFRVLASYARDASARSVASPDHRSLSTVRETLSDPQPFARRGEIAAFQALLDEAERVRTGLAALARDHQRLLEAGAATAAQAVTALLGGAATILDELAAALDEGRAPADLPSVWPALDAAIGALQAAQDTGSEAPPALAELGLAVAHGQAMLGRLRAARRIAEVPAAASSTPSIRRRGSRPRVIIQVSDALQTLRANTRPSSAYFQHALRMAIALAVATLGDRLLPLQRGYWVPMTAVLVLRPDFATTFVRGASRLIGTLAGAALATLIAAALRPGPGMLVALAIVFAWLGYAVIRANYAVYTMTVTAYVVFLLALIGLPEIAGVYDRIAATLIGGLLALLAYTVMPTWESGRAPAQLADLLDAQRRYASLLLGAYTHPQERDAAAIREAQRAAWTARSNAEASVDRMLGEPSRTHDIDATVALSLLASSKRYGFASLMLHAHLADAAVVARPQLRELAEQLDGAMRVLAQALREHMAPAPLPPLRKIQSALADALRRDSDPDSTVLASETDLQVDSIDTMAELLAPTLAQRRPWWMPRALGAHG